jgi:hypothetical protein
VEIKSLGFGLGLSRKVYQDFEVGLIITMQTLIRQKTQVLKLVLTLQTQSKASFGNEKLFKNFGFNVSGRYNTSYLWQSTFADGIAAATVIDAQVNYELPKLKSTLKLGASNIGGKEYGQVLELD